MHNEDTHMYCPLCGHCEKRDDEEEDFGDDIYHSSYT